MNDTSTPRAPHLGETAPTTLRRGHFWVTGRHLETPAGHLQQGQMYVEWMAPAEVTKPFPVVLIHGGGGQGTDWLVTADGRPGWAYRFAAEGYAVYVVDRPGHGRSPHHVHALGALGAPATSEVAGFLFAPADAPDHTQWPWGRSAGDPELEQIAAGMASLLEDSELSQRLDGEAIGSLLERLGRSIVVTHSAGAPAGWLALNAHSEGVAALVAIEPMGPPFADFPGAPALPWGLTATRLLLEPPASSPADLGGTIDGRRIVGFDRAPILVVAAGASGFGRAVSPVVTEFLVTAGADASYLNLADQGIEGNGHALMIERNSDEAIVPILEWIERRGGLPA
jgi:pimeloyl-ACP methyl ester carboxylesterase